jgi:hypothetical protein
MRNLKREATRFVPSALQVNRPQPASIGPKILPGGGPKTIVHKKANPRPQKAVKSRTVDVDKVCDDFLKELEGLI